ncbi:MAG: cytochrome c3 family protein [Thermodesulfobacteriota bacterium]
MGVLVISLYTSKSQAGIAGTPHDLSGRGWGTNQICVFCHTPHNSASGVNQIVPLWNHGTTAATFTLYSSPSLNAVPGQPAGNSKSCLSCHDGTVAIDTYGTRTGTNFVSGSALLGTDLSNDHPISFTYDAALASADGGLVTPVDATKVVTGIPLYGGKLECASCHNAHDNANGDFLRNTNAGSALCFKCHNK